MLGLKLNHVSKRGHRQFLLVKEASVDNMDMMTSSNGNIFHVTGPLSGEITGFPLHRPVTRSDLMRYRAHYDVILRLFEFHFNS